MPKWTEYTSKDTLADNDEVMLYDATARANKRGLMSKFWNYVVDKMSTAVISKLETNNKTIIGAINALNSDTAFEKLIMLGNSKNAIKITPSVSYQMFFVYGYLSYPWMGVIVSEGKVTNFKFEKVGSEPVSIEKRGEDSLILKYSKIWGQIVISSKYAFNYEILQL
jgi:hypothetical protein